MKPYWEVHGELSMHKELLLFGGCIVVPASMQQETLRKLYQGHQVMSPMSQHLSLVARTVKADQRPCETLPRVCKRHYSTQGTTDPYRTSRLPLAESRIRPVYAWRSHIPHCGWLLFTISRSHQVDICDLTKCRYSIEVSILQIWCPRDSSDRQRSTVRLPGVCRICHFIQLHPHYKQPLLYSK